MIKIVALMKKLRIYFSQTISSVAVISILSQIFIDIFFGTMIGNFVNYIYISSEGDYLSATL